MAKNKILLILILSKYYYASTPDICSPWVLLVISFYISVAIFAHQFLKEQHKLEQAVPITSWRMTAQQSHDKIGPGTPRLVMVFPAATDSVRHPMRHAASIHPHSLYARGKAVSTEWRSFECWIYCGLVDMEVILSPTGD
jgi:hypothetical protein